MINWIITKNETKIGKDYFDNHPSSHKRVYRICDGCGNGKWVKFRHSNKLCRSCSHIGENNGSHKMKGENHPLFGKHPNLETRQKMSNAKMGENHWNYGKVTSDETKEKIRKSLIGIPKSDETCQKMSNSAKGKNFTIEHRINISKGNIDKKLSNETKIKMSCSKQGIKREDWDGFSNKDRPHLISINQCIKLNSYFKGSNAHHITSGVIIYIPSYIHQSIWHRLPNNKGELNMKKINKLALQYLIGIIIY